MEKSPKQEIQSEDYDKWEADQNLFGFFALLYKVDQRLKKEKNINNSIEI
jgi:hypothetical protein